MKYGRIKVDQITIDGNIVEDYDVSLSVSEIYSRIQMAFPGISKTEKDITGEYRGRRYHIRCKNVTYLGNPHPHFKKRIQISNDLFAFCAHAKECNAEPLLIGVYSYDDNTVFVGFDLKTYIEKKAHNSSAHIYSSDLAAATVDGYFEKTDYFNNRIVAFAPTNVNVFLDDALGFEIENLDFSKSIDDAKKSSIDNADFLVNYGNENRGLIDVSNPSGYMKASLSPRIKTFFKGINKKWYGIDCYQEMIDNNYKNKFQPEWPGFYLEYKFNQYLTQENLLDSIRFEQNKTKGGIDLDLYFSKIQMYGDLKAHSEESRGIQGNDWSTVFGIIGNKNTDNHIYYIVCEHSTEKDNLHNYEVTMFWNTAQKKSNLMSYSTRMKNNVGLKRMMLLDINNRNCQYLSVFKQGINSNGKPREPKILIEHDKLKYFIIDELEL